MAECATCRKKFKSSAGLADHVRSTRHSQDVRAATPEAGGENSENERAAASEERRREDAGRQETESSAREEAREESGEDVKTNAAEREEQERRAEEEAAKERQRVQHEAEEKEREEKEREEKEREEKEREEREREEKEKKKRAQEEKERERRAREEEADHRRVQEEKKARLEAETRAREEAEDKARQDKAKLEAVDAQNKEEALKERVAAAEREAKEDAKKASREQETNPFAGGKRGDSNPFAVGRVQLERERAAVAQSLAEGGTQRRVLEERPSATQATCSLCRAMVEFASLAEHVCPMAVQLLDDEDPVAVDYAATSGRPQAELHFLIGDAAAAARDMHRQGRCVVVAVGGRVGAGAAAVAKIGPAFGLNRKEGKTATYSGGVWPLVVSDSVERGLSAAARLGDVALLVFDAPLAPDNVVRSVRMFSQSFRHIALVDESEQRLAELRECYQKSAAAGCVLQ